MINVMNITQYYDVQSKKFKHQGFVELQLKIVNEKLDEIEKDLNESSGIEDNQFRKIEDIIAEDL